MRFLSSVIVVGVVIAIGAMVTRGTTVRGDDQKAAKAQYGERAKAGNDKHPALNNPDKFAWDLFMEISRPVDPQKPDGPVEWEQWALSRRVYADPDKKPKWEDVVPTSRTTDELEAIPLQQKELIRQRAEQRGERPNAFFDPEVATGSEGDEVRMNRATFDYVVDPDNTLGHELFNVEGQEAMFGRLEKVDFPAEAREIKAMWRKVGTLEQLDELKKHYHTAIFERKVDGKLVKEVWGLTALHITTKDLPNWFWATWEHKDNPERESVLPSIDRHGLPGPLKGTKWENYVLRGSQVDFTDSIGRATLLGNSQIEEGFQNTSSCITCHARATIGTHRRRSTEIDRLPVFESATPPKGSIGAPDPRLFVGGDRDDKVTVPMPIKYWQTDFVWSVFRAKRKSVKM